MAKIVAICSSKGGVGKSTLALNLAYAFESINVGLVDTDLQGSLTSLSLMADGLNLIPFEKVARLLELPYDLIIVDTPPYLSANLAAIFNQSDLVLVPTKAGFFDMMAIQSTISLLKESMKQNPTLKAAVVFNMVKHNSSIIKEVKKLTNDFDIPVMKSQITDRVSYTRSIINGGILKSKDKNAIREIVELCEEIMFMLNL